MFESKLKRDLEQHIDTCAENYGKLEAKILDLEVKVQDILILFDQNQRRFCRYLQMIGSGVALACAGILAILLR
jgi:hypothetical protein